MHPGFPCVGCHCFPLILAPSWVGTFILSPSRPALFAGPLLALSMTMLPRCQFEWERNAAIRRTSPDAAWFGRSLNRYPFQLPRGCAGRSASIGRHHRRRCCTGLWQSICLLVVGCLHASGCQGAGCGDVLNRRLFHWPNGPGRAGTQLHRRHRDHRGV